MAWTMRRGFRIEGLAFALVLLLAGSAWATPVTVWYDSSGSGIEAASTAAAQAAGAQLITGAPLFADAPNTPPLFVIDTPDPLGPSQVSVAPTPSRATPTEGRNNWLMTANTQDWDNVWLIFRGHDPGGPNFDFYNSTPSTIGLEIDPMNGWALFQGSSGAIYPGVFVGDLAMGETASIPIEYRVAQQLFLASAGPPGVFVFPQHLVGYATTAPVPEPVSLVLFGAGVAGLAARRRRS